MRYTYGVICKTENCINFMKYIEIPVSEPDITVICGPCGQELYDKSLIEES